MTRVNLVPVTELTDQHLFAEFRELKMIPKSLSRSIAAHGVEGVLNRIPERYVLGAGHVSFFYDKGGYLLRRYVDIRTELRYREIQFNSEALFDPERTMYAVPWNGDYQPTAEALALVRERIASRISMKPQWYRKTTYDA